MNDPHPPQFPPRALRRSRSDRMVGGVCGGLASYLNLDPTLVRILVVVATFVTGGVPLLVYVVALFVMPEEDVATPGTDSPPPPHSETGFPPPSPAGPGFPGAGTGTDVPPPAPAPSPSPATPPTAPFDSPGADDVWGTQGAPWEQAPTPADSDPLTSSGTEPPTPSNSDPEPEPVGTEPQPEAPSDPEVPPEGDSQDGQNDDVPRY